jgi:2-polyprenyl-6-hydroxyphenyl methylase/3-demethylubiquinone-9 3-methyltransferase
MTRRVDPEGYEVDVLQRLLSFRSMSVLDVGCGEGRTTRYIARDAASVVGVDPDAERIELARCAAEEEGSCPVVYRCADAVTMEFPVASFDAVVFSRSL